MLLYTLCVLFIILTRLSLADDVLCPRHPIVQTSQVLIIQGSTIMPARKEKPVEMFVLFILKIGRASCRERVCQYV